MRLTSLLLIILVIAGIIAHALVVVSDVYHADIPNFEESALFVRVGANLYVSQIHYNYTPVFAHVAALLTHAETLPYGIAHRLFITFVDAVLAIVVYGVTRNSRVAVTLWIASAPVLYHGQFDALALIPLALAAMLPAAAVGLGMLAVLIKHNVLPLAWMLWVTLYGRSRALWYLAACTAAFALTFAPYLPDGAQPIFSQVFVYGTGRIDTHYTYAPLLLLPPVVMRLLLFGGIAVLPLKLARRTRYERLLIMSLWVIVFLPTLTPSYLLLPLVCAALAQRSRWLVWMGICTALTVLGGQSVEQWNGFMGLAWGTCTLTLVNELRPLYARYPRRRLRPVAQH